MIQSVAARKRHKVRQGAGDWALDIIVYASLFVLIAVMLYPFFYVIATSISEPNRVLRGEVSIIPKGFDLSSFKAIIKHPLLISSYGNTVFYAVMGTAGVLVFSSLTAYPLSLKRLRSAGFFTKMILFTMFFSGGMIPTFLVVKDLKLINTRWAVIIPSLMSAWNVFVMRSFFSGIPTSLHESAYLDGANDFTTFIHIILPLSKAVLATIGLFAFVGFWNDFFSALLYLQDPYMYPLQMILRIILLASQMTKGAEGTRDLVALSSQGIKSAVIVVAIFPIMCLYPFVQKYFVKGVMVGSIKG